jgi:uncharacterized membrane protein
MLYHALNIKGEHVKGENIFLLFFLMISYLAFNINGEHVKRAKNNISLIFLIIILYHAYISILLKTSNKNCQK